MPARAAISQVTQAGVESVFGTAVACNKKFPGVQITLKPEVGTKFYKASGAKVPSVGVLNQLSTSGSLTGPLTFTEILYLLSGYATLVSSTQIGATAGYTHLIRPAADGVAESNKSFTIQKGDSAAAQQVAGAIINALTIALSRQEATVSGSLIGLLLDNGASLTSSPTTLSNLPVTGNMWQCFLDTTFGGIGTTLLTDVFSASIVFPEKYRAKWVLNSAQTSWKEGVEIATEPTVTLVAEYSSQMRALYDALLANTLPTYYLRIKAVGANIGTSADYTTQFDFAVKLKNATPQEDQDGVYAYTFEFQVMFDATMGRPYSINIVNILTGL